jgi:hypothetical protein
MTPNAEIAAPTQNWPGGLLFGAEREGGGCVTTRLMSAPVRHVARASFMLSGWFLLNFKGQWNHLTF